MKQRDVTREIIRRYVRQSGDGDLTSIARETGIPAYIVVRYAGTINDAQLAYFRAQEPATDGGTVG